MTTTINASASSGLISTADTSTILALQTNGTTAVTIDASQKVGIGVTPSAWGSAYTALQVKNFGLMAQSDSNWLYSNSYFNGTSNLYTANGYAGVFDFNGVTTGGYAWRIAASGTAGNAVSFTQAMTLDASGNLLVGTTSTANAHILQTGASGVYSTQFVSSTASSPYGSNIRFSGAAPNGTSNQFLYCNDSSALRMEVRGNGGIGNYSANDVNLSDRREKTNFAPATSYLDKICAIPVQTFNYIDQNLETDGGLTLGVVAQDVQAVAPELVMESNWAGKDDEPKMRLSIYQTDLQYALMKCIQEQQVLITQLQADVAALKGNHG
jgi:hypothetical protein